MQNENFDGLLQEKISQFETRYKPVFDGEGVWQRSISTQRRAYPIIGAAMIVVCLLLAFLLYQEPPIKQPSKSSVRTEAHQFAAGEKPVLSSPKPDINELADNEATIEIKRDRKDRRMMASSDSIIYAAIDSTTEPPLATLEPNPLIELNPTPVLVEREATVTFRRGKPKTSPPAEVVALKKFRIRIFESQPYDSSSIASGAEATAERKFKIKF